MVSDSNSRHNQMQYPQVRVGLSCIGCRKAVALRVVTGLALPGVVKSAPTGMAKYGAGACVREQKYQSNPGGTGGWDGADGCDCDRNGNGKGGGVTADGGHGGHGRGAQRGARAVGLHGKRVGGDGADADAWLQGCQRHTAHRGGGGDRQRRHRRPRRPPLVAVAPLTAGPPTSAPAPPRIARPCCTSANPAATAARRVPPPFGCAWETLPRQAGASGAAASDVARRPSPVGCARRAARPPSLFPPAPIPTPPLSAASPVAGRQSCPARPACRSAHITAAAFCLTSVAPLCSPRGGRSEIAYSPRRRRPLAHLRRHAQRWRAAVVWRRCPP